MKYQLHDFGRSAFSRLQFTASGRGGEDITVEHFFIFQENSLLLKMMNFSTFKKRMCRVSNLKPSIFPGAYFLKSRNSSVFIICS